ncbi:DUF3265 domain-containing protein [Aeromonas veronii]|nr:DUF3265 domain-containing protein [Aeromonas veronii]HDN9022487.1 DUF3265 domain-containing protein [Aeromonas veronii]
MVARRTSNATGTFLHKRRLYGFVRSDGAYLTNASRGTANAWHFYYALVFVITVLCGSLLIALAAP